MKPQCSGYQSLHEEKYDNKLVIRNNADAEKSVYCRLPLFNADLFYPLPTVLLVNYRRCFLSLSLFHFSTLNILYNKPKSTCCLIHSDAAYFK